METSYSFPCLLPSSQRTVAAINSTVQNGREKACNCILTVAKTSEIEKFILSFCLRNETKTLFVLLLLLNRNRVVFYSHILFWDRKRSDPKTIRKAHTVCWGSQRSNLNERLKKNINVSSCRSDVGEYKGVWIHRYSVSVYKNINTKTFTFNSWIEGECVLVFELKLNIFS